MCSFAGAAARPCSGVNDQPKPFGQQSVMEIADTPLAPVPSLWAPTSPGRTQDPNSKRDTRPGARRTEHVADRMHQGCSKLQEPILQQETGTHVPNRPAESLHDGGGIARGAALTQTHQESDWPKAVSQPHCPEHLPQNGSNEHQIPMNMQPPNQELPMKQPINDGRVHECNEWVEVKAVVYRKLSIIGTGGTCKV